MKNQWKKIIAASVLLSSLCQAQEKNPISISSKEIITVDSNQYYKEPFRPQFHFSPEKKWMNDPNGMLFYKGTYHLFYQYYPEDIVWGPMHWGHATSTDLIHWQHKKIALFPDQLGLIFSGSAVMDTYNTSGLGTKENPPMIAVFTYHNMEFEKAGKINTQTQGLAYSLDEGETWTKYQANPIINNTTLRDFRDPKVFWNNDTKLWNLVLVAGDRAQFYTSKNLINWNLESEFGQNKGAHGGVWECPDLFKLKINGTQEEKWVLLVSINPGAPNGGSATQYFVGDFDGKTFTSSQKETKWVDYGTDNYAGVTYNNAPNGERIFLGWMSNWNYARDTPTTNWRSAMTLPRTLSLSTIKEDYVLQSKPIPQLEKQLTTDYKKEVITLHKGGEKSFAYPNFNQSQIQFKAENKNLKLVFSNEANDLLVLHYDAQNQTFAIDRTHSGKVDFEKSFGEKIHTTPTPNLISKNIDFQIIMDWSSIEIFLNGGVYSFTEQIFPNQPYTKLTIQSVESQEIKNTTIQSVKRIW
ncbi:MAG: Levanase precursor [Bacteroidota bacterium]